MLPFPLLTSFEKRFLAAHALWNSRRQWALPLLRMECGRFRPKHPRAYASRPPVRPGRIDGAPIVSLLAEDLCRISSSRTEFPGRGRHERRVVGLVHTAGIRGRRGDRLARSPGRSGLSGRLRLSVITRCESAVVYIAHRPSGRRSRQHFGSVRPLCLQSQRRGIYRRV